MGHNICLKLSHLENVLVLDEVADVTPRSSHPGRGLQWKPRCIWFSPEAAKLEEAVFSAFPFTVCDLCNSFGLANREVSPRNRLYSKGTVCLFLNSVRSKSRTIFLQVEYTEQTLSRSDVRVLYFPLQKPFPLFRKRHRTHSCYRTVNSMRKKKLKGSLFFKENMLDHQYLWNNQICWGGWQLGFTFLSTWLTVNLWDGQMAMASGSGHLKQVTI